MLSLLSVHSICKLCWNVLTNDGLYFSLAAFLGMNNNDEESQNSSETSYNEVVTATMAVGFAIADMMQVPTQGNHYVSVPEPTGR